VSDLNVPRGIHARRIASGPPSLQRGFPGPVRTVRLPGDTPKSRSGRSRSGNRYPMILVKPISGPHRNPDLASRSGDWPAFAAVGPRGGMKSGPAGLFGGMSIGVGRVGIWRHPSGLTSEVVAEAEALGYGAIWVGGSPGGDLAVVESLLDSTDHIAVATGIVNVSKDDAATVAASYHRITARHPRRFLLGLGIGHPETTREYQRPYAKLVSYLDELDDLKVPAEGRVLAALGPKVLKLAADRTAGAHPYLVTPEHTRQARHILGPGPLLAPEQKVVLETDPEKARAIGRPRVQNPYLGLTNYLANLRRLGWTDADFADGGSDALIGALVVHGDAEAIGRGVTAHLDAGADHVAVQVLGPDPLPALRFLGRLPARFCLFTYVKLAGRKPRVLQGWVSTEVAVHQRRQGHLLRVPASRWAWSSWPLNSRGWAPKCRRPSAWRLRNTGACPRRARPAGTWSRRPDSRGARKPRACYGGDPGVCHRPVACWVSCRSGTGTASTRRRGSIRPWPRSGTSRSSGPVLCRPCRRRSR
jgi:probable F420-dependent oxidoreductase